MISASIPKGTRDFLPEEVVKREYIFANIRDVFKRYGYQPIETPAMENLATLMGKYGDEGDKLLFKILNSGDFLEKFKENDLEPKSEDFFDEFKKYLEQFGHIRENPKHLPLSFDLSERIKEKFIPLSLLDSKLTASFIAEKGLRYDLTVPFARYVVQHRNEITFPFKRYQIQPVWRADRPQKGRYREFYQCDVDVIGSNSILNEAELVQIIDDVFTGFGLKVSIRINHRKILYGIAEYLKVANRFDEFVTAIDKLDKIGETAVLTELKTRGIDISERQFETVFGKASGTDNNTQLSGLHQNLKQCNSVKGLQGIEETELLLDYLKKIDFHNSSVVFDPALARGLSYYTGIIIEVTADDVQMGSICGGGRYDDLTGIFGMPGIPGTGISFGAERIYDVLNELKLFPKDLSSRPVLMCVNFGTKEAAHCLEILARIRKAGIAAELYPDPAKMNKQLSYANNKGIPFVLIVGEDEISNNLYTLKNMITGEQQKLTADNIIIELKSVT